MGLTQKPVRPVVIDFQCNECNIGFYRPTGHMAKENNGCGGKRLIHPILFEHECTHCKDMQNFPEKYPTVRYTEEGSLLNLDDYVPQSME